MKIKTGLLSLMIVCGACSRTTQPADVLKDNFDFASGQLNFAFSEIDQVKSAFTEEQKEKMLVSPRNIEPDGSLHLVASRDWCSGFFPGELWYMYEYTGKSIGDRKQKSLPHLLNVKRPMAVRMIWALRCFVVLVTDIV